MALAGGQVVKSLSITKWSRRDDACGALQESYSEILEALEKFESDATRKASARCEARGLINSLDKLETAFMTVFLAYLLQIFLDFQSHSRQPMLTSSLANLNKAAKNLLPDADYQEVRQRRRTLCPGKSRGDDETILDRRTYLKRNVFLPILDNVSTELKKRARGYQAIYKKSSFLE